MPRITWLDSCRGLAILFLIAIHYIGALESRSYISAELLQIGQAFFRVATPFFIFTFGFTFYIAYQKRIANKALKSIYNRNFFKKVLYILIAREVIALILAIRFPQLADNIFEVLTFQSFSMGGEILVFYFFAILVAPINLKFLLHSKLPQYIITWCVIYGISFFIGSTYVNHESYGVVRFLFYDVYPFFPFLSVMALGMLMANFYQKINNKERIIYFSLISFAMLIIGVLGFYSLSSDVLLHLAQATYKAPPNIFYISFYVGLSLFIILVLAYLNEVNLIPKPINSVLSTIGRYSLIAYVLHYTFYLAAYIPKWLGKGVVWEVILMVAMLVLSYLYICWWDKYRQSKINRYKD